MISQSNHIQDFAPPGPMHSAVRITLSIGLYATIEEVRSGLAALSLSGVDCRGFSILVPDVPVALSAARIAGLVLAPHPAYSEGSACDDPLMSDILAWLNQGVRSKALERGSSRAACRSEWRPSSDALDQVTRRLASHLQADGAVMVGRVGSTADQHEVCSIMLKHASGGVLTHQLRIPRAVAWR
ncbi:MAG: hypothetical protein KDJ47_08695 [Hyphomicrobiaceae bacterium]|nr:hypothetical protein [Hyphomicrobiaceae bacterium]